MNERKHSGFQIAKPAALFRGVVRQAGERQFLKQSNACHSSEWNSWTFKLFVLKALSRCAWFAHFKTGCTRRTKISSKKNIMFWTTFESPVFFFHVKRSVFSNLGHFLIGSFLLYSCLLFQIYSIFGRQWHILKFSLLSKKFFYPILKFIFFKKKEKNFCSK